MATDEPHAHEQLEHLAREVGELNSELAERNGDDAALSLHRRTAVRDELFRLLIDSVRDYAIFMLDPSGRIATWNPGAERLYGHHADHIVGQHFSVFYPREDVSAGKCEMELDGANRDGHFEDEGWRVRQDGTTFWANVVISSVRDASGTLVGFSKVTRDLSDRRRGEEARLAAEERYRLIIESIRDYAIFMLDPNGRAATWNVGAERLYGYSADDIIGRHFSVFYPREDVNAGKCEMELEIAAREGRFEDEGWRVRQDLSRFWANVVISAVTDAGGRLLGFSKVTRDLTERKRAEDERAARLAAEQASRAKDEFLAMLGHELRNPLAPIATAVELLKLRAGSEPSKELDVIDRQVRHMSRLLDDLMDVARIVEGKIQLKHERLDLRDVIAKAIEIASPLLEQREHHLDVSMPDQPLFVRGDDARMTQVFANLLVNAAKYTDPGGHIGVVVKQERNELCVAVRDDGVGIEPALLPRVFDLLVQSSQASDRSRGGLGLGLTLVRTLTGIQGGRVSAHSDGVGHGSTFTVWFPRAESDPPTTAVKARSAKLARQRRRVLIVDDNEDALELLGEALTAAGHDVRIAADPVAGLEAAREFQPDVAILDIGLPVMDGYELAKRLRDAQPTAARLQLIALTGYAQQSDHARATQAGFDAHLVKPVTVQRIVEVIDGGERR